MSLRFSNGESDGRMNRKIRCRYNVMAVHTLRDFINIKGGYHNGIRDVYFVRALGASPDLPEQIAELDRMMQGVQHVQYIRLKQLPRLADQQTAAYYTAAYEAWCRDHQRIGLKTPCDNAQFAAFFSDAVQDGLELFRQSNPNATQTMQKNFAVKLWFWMDTLPELITGWSERMTVKILAEDVTKPQEYLFYYLLTGIGCDVALLNTQADIAQPCLCALSHVIHIGAFGAVQLPAYQKMTKQQAQPQQQLKSQPKQPTAGKTAESKQPAEKAQTVKKTAKKTAQKREKSAEKLAMLAASVVMIAVHDAEQEPKATGSGIMIGKSGYILTNYHVIRGGAIFAVRIENEEEIYVTDEVIKYNAQLDLAVIRIERKLKPIPLYDGRKQLVRGQKVIAIGSPLGLFNSVSDGIISGFRQVDGVDMIQFTAPISHGSSGGAVLNMYGELIGISTAGIDSGQNLNLAVGYEDIRAFAKGLYGR